MFGRIGKVSGLKLGHYMMFSDYTTPLIEKSELKPVTRFWTGIG
jgi:hypothetical protein